MRAYLINTCFSNAQRAKIIVNTADDLNIELYMLAQCFFKNSFFFPFPDLGYFLKQTTHGWDHRVHVTLQQETSAREETSTLYLVWGKTESKNTGRLSLKTVSSTQMMKLNGK